MPSASSRWVNSTIRMLLETTMPTYKAPVSDTVFLLSDVFDYARYANSPGFAEAPIDVVEAVLTEGHWRFNTYCSPCHDRTGSGAGIHSASSAGPRALS